MSELNNLTNSIENLIRALDDVNNKIRNLNIGNSNTTTYNDFFDDQKQEFVVDSISPDKFNNNNDKEEFEILKKALKSDRWPEAINSNLICSPDEQERLERGIGILDLLVDKPLEKTKFLDFGCGEGHCCVAASKQNASISVGYDIQKHESWNKFNKDPKIKLTDNFDEVAKNGPYDIIMIYDVLDHAKNESMLDLLIKAKSVLNNKGVIHLRCHPFISRHGSHLYNKINKAFIHLVFNDSELKEIVPDYETPNQKVIYPIITYEKIIKQAGLKYTFKRDTKEEVEPYFKVPLISKRIISNTTNDSFPEFQMSMEFLDYTLTHE